MDATADMRTFVRVVERGSFSAAAEELEITPSAVSKLVTRLEDRLGVRLLHRTTRRLALTPEGETYHLRARDILAAIADAEIEVSRGGDPQGRLRVNSVIPFALHQIAQALPDFIARYPRIEVEIAATDRVVDLLVENTDVAIRTGPIDDPSLVVRKIAVVERGIFASPTYLARRGTPHSFDELAVHDCIRLSSSLAGRRWLFHDCGRVKALEVQSRIVVDNSEAALQLALASAGIIRVCDIVVGNAVRDGRLVELLTDSHVTEPTPLSAAYPLGQHRMPKVRAFIDFLVERFSHAPWREALAPAQRN
jgi:DNA-binding transcriptional LysR family regulator